MSFVWGLDHWMSVSTSQREKADPRKELTLIDFWMCWICLWEIQVGCVCVWSLWSVREWTLRIRWRLSRSYIQGTSTTPVGFHCVFYFLVGYPSVQLSRGPEDIWTQWWGLCHWKWLPLARNKVGEDLEHIGKDLSSFRKISGPVPIWALLHWTPALSVNTSCRKMPFPSSHPPTQNTWTHHWIALALRPPSFVVPSLTSASL